MKKAADAEKKKTEKESKVHKKVWSKNQLLDIRRLALNNSQVVEVDIFKNILSDPSTTSYLLNKLTSYTDKLSIPLVPLKAPMIAKHTLSDKKKTKSQALAGKGSAKTTRQSRPLIPPPVVIELI